MAEDAKRGTCEWIVTRTACKGKETESFGKCKGKAKCDPASKSGIKGLEACAKLAEDECANSRLEVTKSKDITATFDDGSGVKKVNDGKNVCKADRKDFHGCK